MTIRTSFKPNPFPYNKAVPQIGNFDYVDVISSLIIKLIEKNASGVFNVGTEKKTMLDLAKRTVLDVGSCDSYNVLMPKDVSMDLTKLKEFLK